MAELTTYLKDIEARLGELHESGLFLRLQVNVDNEQKLLQQYDLDNYLQPLVKHLGPSRFQLVSGLKRVNGSSRVTVGVAEPGQESLTGWRTCEIPPGQSYLKSKRKDEIRRALENQQPIPLPAGPVEIKVSWRCPPPPRVNWVNFWKPTVDSMIPILGGAKAEKSSTPLKPGTIERLYNPDDGRIVNLELQRSDDPGAGHGIAVRISWRVSPASA